MAAVWQSFTTNKQWEQYLKQLVKTNDVALLKAIVLIYDNQTDEEKYKGKNVEDNNVGFTKYDAREMSEIALKIKAKIPLSEAEMAKSRNKMQKYWKQLMVISKRRMAEKKSKEDVEQQATAKRRFQDSTEALIKCSEEGIACGYGICDECPVTRGSQMRFDLREETENERSA